MEDYNEHVKTRTKSKSNKPKQDALRMHQHKNITFFVMLEPREAKERGPVGRKLGTTGRNKCQGQIDTHCTQTGRQRPVELKLPMLGDKRETRKDKGPNYT